MPPGRSVSRRWHRRWPVLLLGLCLGGCARFVAHQIENPGRMPASARHLFASVLRQLGFARDRLRQTDGPDIAYWYRGPAQLGVHLRYRIDARHGAPHIALQLQLDHAVPGPALTPRGSVLLLHPWGAEGSAMIGWAALLAQSGYVVVAPDLRDQGDSGRARVGYGPREAGDMVDLVHSLRARRALPAPLYLLGVSYGASVALFTAPRLASLRGVVALEPYADAAAVIRRAPASGLFGYRWLARWLTPATMRRAIGQADRDLGLDLAAIDAAGPLRRSHVCTLVIHGGDDHLLPAAVLRRLAARSPRARYVEVPGTGHLGLALATDRLLPPLLTWMQALARSTADTPCPAAPRPLPRAAMLSAGAGG